MTLTEFQMRIKRYRRIEILSVVWFIAVMMISVVPARYIADRIETAGFDLVCITIITVSFPAIAVALFYALARHPQRALRRLGLNCPACDKALVGLTAQVVVASGNCGFCGGKILER